MTTRPTGRFKRCPKCKALLRRTVELCPQCGASVPIAPAAHPTVRTDTLRRLRAVPDPEESAPAASLASHYLLVVSRDRRELYEYLHRVFARETAIEVVLERRIAERRQKSRLRALDRRRRERRQHATLDGEIRRFGFAVVRLD